MRKKRGVNFSILIIIIVFITNSVSAITTSPSQIMINSEIADKTTTADIFLELETGEEAREISFTIPKEYKNYVTITPSQLTLRRKSQINVKIENLMKLKAGEHNIEIAINDNGKPLTSGINSIIFIKAIVPDESEIKESKNITNPTDEKINPTMPIILSIIVALIIIGTTLFLSKKLSTINRAKEEYFAKEFEAKNIEQEAKINQLISETTNILNSLK